MTVELANQGNLLDVNPVTNKVYAPMMDGSSALSPGENTVVVIRGI